MKKIITLSLLLLIVGCASTAKFEAEMNKFKGSDINDLILGTACRCLCDAKRSKNKDVFMDCS